MRTFLRYSLVALLAVLGMGNLLAAETVTITGADFTAVTNADYSTTKSGVTVAVTASTVNADQLRIFKNQTITISTATGKLTNVKFTCTATGDEKYGPGNFTVNDNGEYTYEAEGTTGTWTGSAASFTLTATTAQVRVTEIVATIEGGEVNPDPEPQPEPEVQQITVAAALELINALADGDKSTETYQVKGYVTIITEISVDYGNATFEMADVAGGTPTLTVFRAKDGEGQKITNAEIIKVGDLVVVEGKLQKYVKNGEITPELASGGKILTVNGVDTGIANVTVGKAYEGRTYNIAGQQVSKAYKGLVIINGRKVVQK